MRTQFGPARIGTLALAGAVLVAVAGCQGQDRSPAAAGSGPAGGQPGAAGTSSGGTSTGGSSAGGLSTAPVSASSGLAPGGAVPRGFVAWSVTFASSQTAYVLGDAPCRRAPCTSVVRTLDGGRSWRGVPAPVAPLPANSRSRSIAGGTVRDIRFGTARDGYAFGGGLWTTHDGARSWHRVNVGAVLDLAVVGGTTYAAVATCAAAGYPCRDLRLLASPVERDAFARVGGLTPGTEAGAGGTVSTGAGIVVANLDGAVYVRRGGGWTRAVAACRPFAEATVAPASGSTLTAFCGEGAAGSIYYTVRQSTDLGRHWSTVPGRALQLPNSLTSLTAGSAAVLSGASASLDLLGGLRVSQDGGRTWAAAALPRTATGWRYVGARSATVLVALPDPPAETLWTSATSGRSWTAQPIR